MSDESNYEVRDLGDGNPIRVQKCPMCGVAPSAVDDCGMPNPDCPYFGKNNAGYLVSPNDDASQGLFGGVDTPRKIKAMHKLINKYQDEHKHNN